MHHHTPLGVAPPPAIVEPARLAENGSLLSMMTTCGLPTSSALQLDAAQAVGRDWAYTGSVSIADRGRILSGRPPLAPEEVVAALPRYNAIPGGGSNVVVRRRMWQHAGQFDTRLRNTEDWEMWIRLAKHGPPACVPRPLLAYRVHTANSSLDVAEIVRGAKLIEACTTREWIGAYCIAGWLSRACAKVSGVQPCVSSWLPQFVASSLASSQIWRAILRRRVARHIRSVDGGSADSAMHGVQKLHDWLTQADSYQEESVPLRTRSR